MAYSPVKQTLADPSTTSYHNLAVVTTPSPRLADLPFAPFRFDFEHGSRETDENGLGTRHEHAESKVSKFLSSLTSSSRQSYEIVEEDDYDTTEQVTPTLERHPKAAMTTLTESSLPMTAHAELPMRTASISRQLPLNHPIPDLQSLQGAYVGNIVRLEESAAELSSKPNLEGELQRIKQEHKRRERAASGASRAISTGSGPQRRVSVRSMTDSIVDANSMAHPGYVASPIGSLKSPRGAPNSSTKRLSKSSRLSSALPEPEFEGRPLDSELTISPTQEHVELDPRPLRSPSSARNSLDDRPTTSGSGDTYQQARSAFTDFDGVHFATDKAERGSRRISLSRPPRARDSRAFKEPQPGEEMIYYPAPVPVMLNLPMRLSRMNWGEQEKKRLQALADISDEKRKSAAWLANEDPVPAPRHRHSRLPPQLRASAFFDQRGPTQDVQLKDGSAVATLDSILDASAFAPVSAFTDHPIVGNLGSEFYASEQPSRKNVHLTTEKKAKRKSSLSNLLRPRRSSGNLSEAMARESRVPSMLLPKREDHEQDDEAVADDAERSMLPGPDELPENESENDEGVKKHSDTESESGESQLNPGFLAAPTTLLAELQMRKAQQKKRNRTAADAFPNGMHSTLLELDTVTQLQLKARRQKHVKLAWEDEDLVDRENFDDDEVPLGILFPEKEQWTNTKVNHNRPMGLMEKKELEENEPLSHRRARLRGEPIQPPPPARSPAIGQRAEEAPKPMLDLPDLGSMQHDIGNDNDEEETLAQRRQRMKERKEHGASADFAQQINNELGLNVPATGTKTPDIEETLGQRRKRLQAEALGATGRNSNAEIQDERPALKTNRSLADVLRANPVGYVDPNQKKTALLAMQMQERAREREDKFFAAQEVEKQRALASRHRFGQGNEGGLIQSSIYGQPMYQQPYTNMSAATLPASYGINNTQPVYGYTSMTNLGVHPQQTNMGKAMGVAQVQVNYPYQQPPTQTFGYQPAMALNGMGPPLDQKQRARIEGWRQGIM